MPKKKDQAEQPAEGVLESAAKTIGTVVGKVVAAVSGTEDRKAPEVQKAPKVPKFAGELGSVVQSA